MPKHAEYHSKRDSVNVPMLKKLECHLGMDNLKSKPIYKTDTPGSQKHMENMEYFASNVNQAVKVRLGVVF